MLDHDELLPEEQAYPGLIQELRTIYQMRPEEKLVLTRVHQRLAQSSHPLPLPEPIQAGGHTQPQWLVSVVSPPARPARFRQRWLRPLNMLAAVLLVGVLVGSLAFAFSVNRSKVGSPPVNSIHVFLVPAEKGSASSQAKWETTRTLLSQRFSDLGLEGSSVRVVTANGQRGILVELPHFGGNEQQTIDILVGTGVLAFWDTGLGAQLKLGTLFIPSQYTQYNPGDQPRFTNQDIDPNFLAVNHNPTGTPSTPGTLGINCIMKGDAVQRFRLYTSNNIGHTLTVTLDAKALSSAVIASSISGPFVIPVDLTQQQASAIVSVLKYGPLPITLKQEV